MAKKVRVGVVGVGHFGRYHAEKYAAHARCELVGVCDLDAERAAAVGAAVGAPALDDASALIGRVDAVSIAVPTESHFAVARPFLEAGVHVLVEKPICPALADADALVALAEANAVTLQVGHLERFSDAYVTIGEFVTTPLYIESYRIAPFRPRGTDVNVILDLMIHDIDMIQALVGAPVLSVDAVGAPVVGPEEDIANTRMRFANGCVASITASRVSQKTERIMRIFQPDSYLQVDFVKASALRIERGEGEMLPGVPAIRQTETAFEKVDALAREIDAFIAAVADGAAPPVSGADGRQALKTALDISDGLRTHWDFVREAAGLD